MTEFLLRHWRLRLAIPHRLWRLIRRTHRHAYTTTPRGGEVMCYCGHHIPARGVPGMATLDGELRIQLVGDPWWDPTLPVEVRQPPAWWERTA